MAQSLLAASNATELGHEGTEDSAKGGRHVRYDSEASSPRVETMYEKYRNSVLRNALSYKVQKHMG